MNYHCQTDACSNLQNQNPSTSLKSFFFFTSCPVDNGTQYDHTMTHIQRFQLVPFRWIPQNFTIVYLHCKVIVCHKNGHSRCSLGCQPSDRRRARSTGKEETHRVTLGPIRLREPQRSTSVILKRGNNFLSSIFLGVGRRGGWGEGDDYMIWDLVIFLSSKVKIFRYNFPNTSHFDLLLISVIIFLLRHRAII